MEKARIPLEVQATANYLNSDPSATTKDVRRYLNNEYPNIAHSYNMALARIKMAHENELITEERRDSTSIYYSKKAFERMEKAAELYRKGKSLGEISKTLPKIINREKSKNMARETARKIIIPPTNIANIHPNPNSNPFLFIIFFIFYNY